MSGGHADFLTLAHPAGGSANKTEEFILPPYEVGTQDKQIAKCVHRSDEGTDTSN